MSTSYFPKVEKVVYEGPKSTNPFAFRHYNPDELVLGKPMRAHLRFAACYWHSFTYTGRDPFGNPTFDRLYQASSDPLVAAEETMRAAFEFFSKLGVEFWCFHDRDIAPEGETLRESHDNLFRIVRLARELQEETRIQPLWGTANLFSHPRYAAGAATNPNPRVFAHAAGQVAQAIAASHSLGAAGYVFWGGREGYDTLLNTDMTRETENLARFLHLAVDHARAIGFKGQFYIEPKPKEPTKHQYDYDAQSVHAFLLKHDLASHFKLNIEANHATLAGHEFHHEIEYAGANGLLGSIDANRGDSLCGWDTDQFPLNLYDTTLAMYSILRQGGFTSGGLNFDAKLRRQSVDIHDLFHAHIGGMDAFARGLKAAARLITERPLENFIQARYAGWSDGLGQEIHSGSHTLAGLGLIAEQFGPILPQSGRQEMLENIFNDYLV